MTSSASAAKRPKHLDLLRISLPLPAKVSILHRVSGALLFLALPVLIYQLDQSLDSAETYAGAVAFFDHPLVKLAALLLVWSYAHHFCAGIRYLLLDLHIGLDRVPANRSAVIVLVASLILTALVGAQLW
ncbi:MAG: succinate dehydrogenase, cytochrome b556 subunit [Betaproteobacteria bacterium]|jgi:succinate dehydrogenase / fumarate reductase cytochrome b subunit|nr:succinate dehydrogenase, cytochrome b556 subunit [Betaproteobacteria bacterium]